MKIKLILLLQWKCPYQLDRSLYEHLINDEKSNFTECASITR